MLSAKQIVRSDGIKPNLIQDENLMSIYLSRGGIWAPKNANRCVIVPSEDGIVSREFENVGEESESSEN